MKAKIFYVGAQATLWLSISVSGFSLAASGAAKPGGPVSTSASTNAIAQQEIPRSVFVIPAGPKEGRNPFFPQSTVQPAPQATRPDKAPAAVDTSYFVLNGITSPPKRTAIINNRTFEHGESGEVKLANGAKVLIKCEEIRNDSAIILIDGQRRELKLRFGL